ncbi:MAG: arginine:pyruvate transaminase [Rhodospirillaceae bacterium]|jgi:arginine:pyruvate transaminase|nr:arginine:pyruvate transaminase [Rhodospirillaceae bacterium]
MKFSRLTDRIGGEGANAWAVHFEAIRRCRSGEDIIVLSVGEPNFDTPPAIVAAAKASLDRGRTHYTDVIGDPPLRAAIARRHTASTGQIVGPENVVVVAGAQCGLFSAALCLLDPGDEIIVPEPMYVTYEAAIGASGASIRRVPLKAENRFRLQAADVAAAIGPRTKAVLINSPHNPTGAVIARSEMEALAELCRKHDLWLISDEVYNSLTFDAPHVSPGGLPGMAERTITVDSVSKSHAMTGWRLGWVVGPKPLMGHIGNLALCMLYGSPGFVQDAGIVALEQDHAELPEMVAALRGRRDKLYRQLAQLPTLAVEQPEAGMFLMVDISRTGLSADDFAFGLLDAERVSVLPGAAFGPQVANYVRINLGAPDEDLAEAGKRIAAFAGRF